MLIPSRIPMPYSPTELASNNIWIFTAEGILFAIRFNCWFLIQISIAMSVTINIEDFQSWPEIFTEINRQANSKTFSAIEPDTTNVSNTKQNQDLRQWRKQSQSSAMSRVEEPVSNRQSATEVVWLSSMYANQVALSFDRCRQFTRRTHQPKAKWGAAEKPP